MMRESAPINPNERLMPAVSHSADSSARGCCAQALSALTIDGSHHRSADR